MRRFSLIILVALSILAGKAQEGIHVEAGWTELDENIQIEASRYILQFETAETTNDIVEFFTFKMDGKAITSTLINGNVEVITTPGEHEFEFYTSLGETVKTVLEIKPRHFAHFAISFPLEEKNKVKKSWTEPDQSIQGEFSKYIFQFQNFAPDRDDIVIQITYKIDGKEVKTVLKDTSLEIITSTGVHEFEFFIQGFEPIKTGKLSVKPKYLCYFDVSLTGE